MSQDDHDKLIRAEVNIETVTDDVNELKRDRKLGIIAILGLFAERVFEGLSKGPL